MAGGATIATILLWRVARGRLAGALQRRGAGALRRCASGRLACPWVIDEKRCVRRQTWVGCSEFGVYRHLDCEVRRRACDTHAEEEGGDSRVWWQNILVATRDVFSYALVTPVPSSVEFTRVFFLDTAGVVFLCCGDCVSCARGCVFRLETRHSWLKKTSSAHSHSHGSGAFVSSMEARLAALEGSLSLRQTEEVLVAERFAWQTAEASAVGYSMAMTSVMSCWSGCRQTVRSFAK